MTTNPASPPGPGTGATRQPRQPGIRPEERTLLFEGTPTRIYRARDDDGREVILKYLANDAGQAGIQHEYDIARTLETEHVVRVYGIERGSEHLCLVLEDFGGESLDRIAARRSLDPEEILDVAIQVSAGLAEIHAANIIHKDINPSNIVYNPETRVAKIIDFGISSYLTREQADLGSPGALVGSLPYVSPEQTGRMNRAVDYRTDFYSLGATLYELLARRPLFDVDQPIEWLHCHIAREPVPLHRVDPAIPRPLADLVGRLLAKTADERYRSAAGIRADLEHCLTALQQTGRIEPFALGRRDLPEVFQIQQHLYGREPEIRTLMASFDRARQGAAELILVSGYSGIGKTCLVKELYRPITSRKGFFVSGKFDQLHRTMPLSAPVSALRDLVRQLLSEPEESLALWRESLLSALAGNGRLIVDLIPDLKLIIGAQPAPRPLSPEAAEQRFHRTLLAFIRAFAKAGHPLVMFLDDLQWADAASLTLIELLLGESALEHLLVIGAFRDNEVHPGHPLTLAVERIARHATVEALKLPPLSGDSMRRLLADALYVGIDQVDDLAELVMRKTGGNPYFTEEFLKDLHRRGMIRLDPANARWSWDMASIEDAHITDNVVDLMSEKLQRLSAPARHMLQLGACIGHRLELGMLLAVAGDDWKTLAPALREAMSQGLISPIGNRCQLFSLEQKPRDADLHVELAFAHDRIQQAAHELLGEDDRQRAHRDIGRLLIDRLSAEDREANLFRITDHLNAARDLVESDLERRELAAWNRAAGARAWESAAHDAARQYFGTAIALLDAGCWEGDPGDTLALYADAADATYMCGDYPACDALVREALVHAPDHTSAARLNQIKLASMIAQGQRAEAVEAGISMMAEFGIRYPRNPGKLRVLLEYLIARWALAGMSLDDLRALPDSTDRTVAEAFGIADQVAVAAQFSRPQILPVMSLRGVRNALSKGVHERSANSFVGLAVQLGLILGQTDRGGLYAQFGQELCSRFPDSPTRGRMLFHDTALLAPWSQPLLELRAPLIHTYEQCLACNDVESASDAVTYLVSYAFSAGLPLTEVRTDLETWRAAVVELNQPDAVALLDCLLQMVINLLGESDDPAVLEGASFDIGKVLAKQTHKRNRRLMLTASARQGMLLILLDRPREALAYMDGVRRSLRRMPMVYDSMLLHFHDALLRLRLARMESGRSRRQRLAHARVSRRILRRWARRIPANAQAKWHLLEAEWFRTRGNVARAEGHYDDAIAAARRHGNAFDETLGNLLAGSMYLDAGRQTVAQAYLGKARSACHRWGAAAIVRHLDTRYAEVLHTDTGERRSHSGVTTDTDSLAGVDISALMKALKAIAQERVHSRMVSTIITTAMEFAGAQHALLLLRDDEQALRIEAEASVDGGAPQILQSIPIDASRALSPAVVNYVTRTLEGVVIHDAQQPGGPVPGLNLDPHARDNQVRSILCLPITGSVDQGDDLIGVLYLENNRTSHTFTEARFDTLEIICVAAAGRLELSRKAAFDGLTGLFNRDYFQSMLHQEMLASERHGHELSLILADIDHFKAFNDTWGHQIGDQVLRSVADAVRDTCRESDIAARYGGEELAVILPDTDAEGALVLAERIRACVEALEIRHGDETLTVTLSLGVAARHDTTPNEDELLRQADEALYRAKHAGRNRVEPSRSEHT